ncbi:hypothetical protein OIU77_003054 [Salix suchowensis]|uniref:C2H2-type domain-containing protein n=1 Tax=Salix suchowensis TaxID=1278906 RepID=A0ABQ9AY95_9ROSI|nr:hypothetical protein OIU77_003054 [Salix suchowensis]
MFMGAEEALTSSCNGSVENPVGGSSNPPAQKKKRNLPGTPDPEAEVIALSPKTLMATNRFLCEICGKGFQRDQNLQLHRRGHNLPWKLKQRTNKEVRKRVYVCPEKTCVHHHPSRALGDLTGIKKHFCRKHGEKKWKCEKCSKRYAVQSDWKAHSKTCGTKEYKCDCGTIFSRRDSFITHRAFCDALAEETARVNAVSSISNLTSGNYHLMGNPLGPNMAQHFSSIFKPISSNDHLTRQGHSLWMSQGGAPHFSEAMAGNNIQEIHQLGSFNWPIFGNKISSNIAHEELTSTLALPLSNVKEAAAAASQLPLRLLQKAAQIGATSTDPSFLGSFKVQDGNNKFCGLYGSSPISTNPASDMEKSRNDQIPTLNQLQMYSAKRQKIFQSDQDSPAGGQTRDFLGVGAQPIRHPPSINGWI